MSDSFALRLCGSAFKSFRRKAKRRAPGWQHLRLEPLEEKRLLASSAPEVIIAADVPGLSAAWEAPGIRAVMVQPSGNVVAAGSFDGSQGDDFTLVRYSANGTLDPTFGGSGTGLVQTNFSDSGKPSSRHDTVWGAEIDSQGRIVVSGHDNRGNLVVARYTPDGQLDDSFSGDGFDTSQISFDPSLQTIAFDADDNTYIAGRSDEYVDTLGDWNDTLRIVKYTSSGSLDSSFGDNGIVSYTQKDLSKTSDPPYDRNLGFAIYEPVSSPAETKLLISGTVDNDSIPTREAFLLRLNSDGSPDSSFGQDGIVTTNVPFDGNEGSHNYGNGVAIDNSDTSSPDRIVVVGLSSHGMNVIRYTSDGALDASFNPNGEISQMPGVAVVYGPSDDPLPSETPSISRGRDVAVDQQGRIVVGAKFDQTPVRHADGVPQNETTPADLDAFVVARLVGGSEPDAHTLDTNFGPDGTGVVETLVGSGWNELTDVTIAPNGDIWTSGRACSPDETCESYDDGQPFDSVLLRFAAPQQPNNAPVADAGGDYSGAEDAAITFDASGSTDLDGHSLTYTWDFGDGTTDNTTEPTIDHVYAWGGSFNVQLTVSDGFGGIDSTTTTAVVTEVNDAPVADAGGPYSGAPGEAISFDASASSDFDNEDGTTANDQALEYNWDFGDGTVVTTSAATFDHTYAAEGTYDVSLTVSDGIDASATVTTATITVGPTGDANDIYVWDIDFDVKSRGPHTDYYILVDVQSDSDADGLASSIDAAAGGVLVTVELRDGSGNLVGTYNGTTDENGVFTSDKIRNLPAGDYTIEVIDLAHETLEWNHLLDPTANDEDSDGDGLPDDVLVI